MWKETERESADSRALLLRSTGQENGSQSGSAADRWLEGMLGTRQGNRKGWKDASCSQCSWRRKWFLLF